jgi:hypothetical protein
MRQAWAPNIFETLLEGARFGDFEANDCGQDKRKRCEEGSMVLAGLSLIFRKSRNRIGNMRAKCPSSWQCTNPAHTQCPQSPARFRGQVTP